jgi:hypothetical protein
MIWIGWAFSGLFAAFLLVGSIAPKLVGAQVAHDSFAQLGWRDSYILLIGGIELAGVVLYLIPRTSVLGAILMTGLLGGAIATHLRVGSPLFTHVLFGLYLGLAMWAGLWLREPTVRAIVPLKSIVD